MRKVATAYMFGKERQQDLLLQIITYSEQHLKNISFILAGEGR